MMNLVKGWKHIEGRKVYWGKFVEMSPRIGKALIFYDYQRFQWENQGDFKVTEVCQRAKKGEMLFGRGGKDGAGSL